MEFEWDEAKSEACAKVRRFNFDYAARAFYDPDRMVEADKRRDYGEPRYRLTGKIDGRLYVVVLALSSSLVGSLSLFKQSVEK